MDGGKVVDRIGHGRVRPVSVAPLEVRDLPTLIIAMAHVHCPSWIGLAGGAVRSIHRMVYTVLCPSSQAC